MALNIVICSLYHVYIHTYRLIFDRFISLSDMQIQIWAPAEIQIDFLQHPQEIKS